MRSPETVEAFRQALNKACGEIDEAAGLSQEIFEGDTLKSVRRELARLMEQIDTKFLIHLQD